MPVHPPFIPRRKACGMLGAAGKLGTRSFCKVRSSHGNPCGRFGGIRAGIHRQRAGVRGLLGHLVRPVPRVRPVYEQASEKHPDVYFAKVDIDQNQDLASAAGVQAVPTLMIVKQGTVVFQQAGALRASDLEDSDLPSQGAGSQVRTGRGRRPAVIIPFSVGRRLEDYPRVGVNLWLL